MAAITMAVPCVRPTVARVQKAGAASRAMLRARVPAGLGKVAGFSAPRTSRLVTVRASDEVAAEATAKAEAPAPAPMPEITRSSCTATVEDESFNISKVSFGTIGLSVGLVLLSYGFFGYFNFLPGGSISALLLIYGFPISLIGFALKYAELLPLDCVTYTDALALRETQTTSILTQVRNDVTRYRYGDEQHLEEALKIIFRYNRPGGLRRNQAPQMAGIAEQVINGRYALLMTFESPKMELSDWTERQQKIQGFFGPGVVAAITEIEEGKVEVALISEEGGSGSSGGDEDMEVLPPLMPGLAPRYVKKGTA